MHARGKVWGQAVLGLVALLPFVNGCGPSVPYREQPSAEGRIQKLAGLCSKYALKTGKKPTSIDDLKSWAKRLSKAELDQLGIPDPETAFVSPRDNQPYVLVKSAGSTPADILAYEQVGEGGKHYVVNPMGNAFELDDAGLKRRLSSAR